MSVNLPLVDMIQRIATTVVSNWWKAVGVSLTWAYVMSVDPLRLRPVGQTETVESTPESLVPKLYVGDRVLAARFGSAWAVLGRIGPDKGAIPVGGMIDYVVNAAPNEVWALTDGSVYDPIACPELFAIMGTTFGGSEAEPLLPNTANRVVVGLGTDTLFNAVGKTGGEKAHTQTVDELAPHGHVQNSHNHTQNAHGHSDLGHQHGPGNLSGYYLTRSVDDSGSSYHGATQYIFSAFDRNTESGTVIINGGATSVGWANIQASTATNNATTATNQNTGGGQAFNIVQWYITLPKLIRVA